MAGERYKHIFLRDIPRTQGYTSPNARGPRPRIRIHADRDAHSSFLRSRLEEAWRDADARAQQAAVFTEREGAYIEFAGEPGYDLIFKSLEDLRLRDKIRLLNVREEVVDNVRRVFATVFVPFSQRGYFLRYIDRYAEGRPNAQKLFNSIANIRAAVLESFWNPEERNKIPNDEQQWVEVWLRDERGEASQTFDRVLEANNIEMSTSYLKFPERTVRLVKTNRTGLDQIITYSDAVAEMRAAHEVSSFFIKMGNADQALFAQDLLNRTVVDNQNSVVVCVLDTGINNGHVLLRPFLSDVDLHAVEPAWGTHDHDGHGTLMAGNVLYGDINDVLQGNEEVRIGHILESAKILPPPPHQNSPELWGYMAAQGISRAEIQAPDRKRIVCMAVTASDFINRGAPTSWSAELDKVTSGAEDDFRRLILVSAGNVFGSQEWNNYTNSNTTSPVEDPGQSWNALTVGAYTEKTQIRDPRMAGYRPLAPASGLSPFSRTSKGWASKWPIKPEVVLEGGNVAAGPNMSKERHTDLELLSTNFDPQEAQFDSNFATSASTALASNMAARIQSDYPEAWPETIRGLLVHSASWSDEMKRQFLPANPRRSDYAKLLRICGYGTPHLERALYCASNSLTLISQADLQPYDRHPVDNRLVTRDMHVYRLPWPAAVLADMGEIAVSMRVTLSYFIEPGPGEIGWKDRYRYPSHGLRFQMNGPGENEVDFTQRVNAQARDDDHVPGDTAGPGDRWIIGEPRNVGSIHSDIWIGNAVDLATSHLIAVYPIVGWWRERKYLNKWNRRTRYALIVSIYTPEEEADVYVPVAQTVGVPIPVEVRVDRA